MDPFVGEIRAVAFSYAPQNWALCDGSLMQINQFRALFAILGTQYGGDGRTTFALPDLRGRAVVNAGQGPGLSNYPIGQKTGTETETLTLPQLPLHSHGFSGSFNVSTDTAGSSTAAHNFLAVPSEFQYAETGSGTTMGAGLISGQGSVVGGNQAHTNQQPYLVLNYIIALMGEFPVRS
jgi:microcystin-dependent protein